MSPQPANALPLHDLEPARETFRRDVLAGLRKPQKELPCKYFYDESGSRLFEKICELEEYYPTRTELAIMDAHAPEMAEALGERCLLFELGSGSGQKTRTLLDHLAKPTAYVPVDIARDQLLSSAAELAAAYPGLAVLPVCADFTQEFELPEHEGEVRRRVAYFPGSTLGNFGPARATELLGGLAERVETDGNLLIGIDLHKDRETLERAYDDAQGVTADFNRNLLRRINRELDGDFDLEAFRHHAFYDDQLRRVEMHLVSEKDQEVSIGDERLEFRRHETIHTESSHKYSLEDFAEMAGAAGFAVAQVWTDAQELFSVQLLAAF